jgi:hypothetical protein
VISSTIPRATTCTSMVSSAAERSTKIRSSSGRDMRQVVAESQPDQARPSEVPRAQAAALLSTQLQAHTVSMKATCSASAERSLGHEHMPDDDSSLRQRHDCLGLINPFGQLR